MLWRLFCLVLPIAEVAPAKGNEGRRKNPAVAKAMAWQAVTGDR